MLVNIMNSREDPRARTLEDKLPAMVQMDFFEALATHWEHKQHFVTYSLPDDEPCPPLTKQAARAIGRAGSQVLQQALVWDLDTNPHLPWESPEKAREEVQRLAKVLDPTAIYSTARGARVILALEHPTDPDTAQELHRKFTPGIQEVLAGTGLEVDSSSREHLRCFKMPTTTEFQDAVMIINRSIEVPVTGDLVPAEWVQQAYRRLRGRDVWQYVKHPGAVPVPLQGSRHNVMLEKVGSVVAMTRTIPGTTPEHIARLLEPWVSRFPEEEADRPPLETLAALVEQMWEADEVKAIEAGEPLTPPAPVPAPPPPASAPDLEDEEDCPIVANLREIYGRLIPSNFQEAWEWARRHAIAAKGSSYFVLKKDGYFTSEAVNYKNLIAEIRRFADPEVIPIEFIDQNGNGRALTVTNILNEHVFSPHQIKKEGISKPGGRLEWCGYEKFNLIYPVSSLREDIKATYHPEVDQWLQKMFKGDLPKVERWIWGALSTELGYPICALFLCGPASVGKKLFSQGLVECFSNKSYATERVFCGFQPGLDTSPILLINEGLPKDAKGDPGEIMRQLIGGDPILVNKKYQPEMMVKNPIRCIIMSNDDALLYKLAGSRCTSQHDREALALRFLTPRVHGSAAEYLAGLGGVDHTGRRGSRWIASDGASDDNQSIVAQHFLWIHAKCKTAGMKSDSRFIVQGDMSKEAEQHLRLESGSNMEVAETLIRLIEDPTPRRGYTETKEGVICVTTSAVREALQRQLPARQVTRALRALSVGESRQRSLNNQNARWWTLDLDTLWLAVDGDHYYTKLAHLSGNVKRLDIKQVEKELG